MYLLFLHTSFFYYKSEVYIFSFVKAYAMAYRGFAAVGKYLFWEKVNFFLYLS